MAKGKPIITTDMLGCNLLAKSNLNDILVKSKIKEDLIRALEQHSSTDLKEMGGQSKQIYKEYYSEDMIYNQLQSNYSK